MMASNSFLDLVLGEMPMGYAQREAVYKRVCAAPRLVSALLDDTGLRDQFFIDFPDRVDRLVEFIKLVERENSRVAKELWLKLIIPILKESEEVDCDGLVKLLASALPLIPESVLETFAVEVVQPPRILERLVSAKLDDRVQDRIHSFAESIKGIKTLEIWTRRIVTLCESCPYGHGLRQQKQRWRALVDLRRAMEALPDNYSYGRRTFRSNDLPILAGMRQLTENDKKKNRARQLDRRGHADFTLPSHMEEAIRAFGKPVPTSESQLQMLTESLEKETREILAAFIGSYPCRPCEELTRCALMPVNTPPREENSQVEADSGPGLYGKRLGVWNVSLSSPALKDLKDLRIAGNGEQLSSLQGLLYSTLTERICLYERAEEKLRDLGVGLWRGLSNEAGASHQRVNLRVPLMLAKVTKQLYILWQIDVGFDAVVSSVQQFIKVWKIDNIEQISRAVERVTVIQRTYNFDFISRCTKKPPKNSEGKFVPFLFDKDTGAAAAALEPNERMDIRNTDKEVIEMANKFYSLTEPVIKSIISDNIEAEYPFDISEEEVRILRHSETSSLILGRSGTGKTTCLVYKLLSKYLARREVSGERKLRQVLLTRSAFLSTKLRTYTRRLIETQTCKALQSDGSKEPDEALIETEDDISVGTISALTDDLFPLVCTYDQLLRALENTVRAADRKDFSYMADRRRSSTFFLPPAGRKPQTVDFYTFKVDYWPQFANTRSLPIELVFAEIMGIVKGSTSSKDSLQPLSRVEYLTKGRRQAPIFTLESDRSRVYNIYEDYEAIKRRYGDVDYIDRVVKVLKAIQEDETLRERFTTAFDEVYVDEVQDQRSLDIELLLNIVRDARGFHLAGDTAQSISKDATFRFADIKALFYTHFFSASETAKQADLAKPKLFTLSRNYRSHQGILSLASLIMRMLSTGFPDTVDRLEPEIGQLSGPKPTFFVRFSAQILSTQLVGLVNLNERIADFGAEQVILVRDEDAKQALQAQIGDVALILTILQSKGMEFDDVILFNFFTDSSCHASLRCLGLLVGMGGNGEFDAMKHMVLCSELKHLYVAITRARIQLSIIESSEDRAVTEVIRVFTEHTGESLVDVVRPEDSNVSEKVKSLRSGKSIDPQRWARKGAGLMSQKNFADALFCYNKAGDVKGQKTAKALLFEEKGRLCRAKGDHSGFEEHILAAVNLFRDLEMTKKAAENLESLGRFEEAANLWLHKGSHREAAHMFLRGNFFKRASECFHILREYDETASALRQGRLYDDLVVYLYENCPLFPEKSFRAFSRVINVHLKHGRISLHLRSQAIDLLGSDADQEAFFRMYDMHEQLAEFYEDRGRYRDLFNLQIQRGLVTEAMRTVVQKGLGNDIDLADLLHVLHYVRAGMTFSGHSNNGEVELETIKNCWDSEVARAERDWGIVRDALSDWANVGGRKIGEMGKGIVREAAVLHILIDHSRYLSKSLHVDQFPLELIRDAVAILRDILTEGSEYPKLSAIYLLSGVYRPLSSSPQLLDWSPLKNSTTEDTDFRESAKSWIIKTLSSSILTLDECLKETWRQDWPARCHHYLARGACRWLEEGECSLVHNAPTADDCARRINGLLRIASLYCDLEIIYRSQAMTQAFNEQYWKMRRYWLERLLQALTYLSSFEHHTRSLTATQNLLLQNRELTAVASSLEDLLFHRLGREWGARKSLSALMEQIQLAQSLNVDRRFMRALSYKLNDYYDQNLQHASKTLSHLRAIESARSAQFFRTNLTAMLDNIERANPWELVSFHAVTSVVEYIATYLIFLTCPGGVFMVPQAWIDLHLPLVANQGQRDYLSEADRYSYRQSLLFLLVKFCAILQNIDQAFTFTQGSHDERFNFVFGGRSHKPYFFQRRNADALAIILINIAVVGFQLHGFESVRGKVQEMFRIKHRHLDHVTMPQLAERLHQSFASYAGKDSLLIVTPSKSSQPGNLLPIFLTMKKLGVKMISLDEALATNVQRQRQVADEASHDEMAKADDSSERYSDEDAARAIRIQKIWRHIATRLKDRRTWKQTPLARIFDQFISLGSAAGSKSLRIQTRYILLDLVLPNTRSIPLLTNHLTTLRARGSKIVDDPSLSQEKMEKIDDLFEELETVEKSLENVRGETDEKPLRDLVESEDLGVLRRLAWRVQVVVKDAERRLGEVEEKLAGLGL